MDATLAMIHAFVNAKFDYCNSILYGLPKKQIRKLQGIQNTAARLVTNNKWYDHITPILKDLHWLPIDKWIIFKVLFMTH